MVQQYGGDGRELLLCFPGEFLGMGHFIAIDDKAQHNAAINGRLTQIKMPQQAFPCLFIVDGKPMGIGIMTHPCGDLAENHRLQGTVPAGNDSMAARRKKSGIAASIALPKGKLSLIAVACVAGGGQNRQRLYCKAADAPHGILYPALLFPQLRFVGDVPQATSAAALIAGAVKRNTIRGRGDDLFDDAIAVAFLHLYDSHSQFISGGGHWHKDRDAISVPDAAALIGDGFYGMCVAIAPSLAESKPDCLQTISGENGTTYSNLFDVILSDDYDSVWEEHCKAIVGEENAAEAVEMLKSFISGDVYGDDAVALYGDGSEGFIFDCWYLNDVKSFTMNGDEITINKLDGTSETHKYRCIGTYQIGADETMTWGGETFCPAFDCEVYQATDDAGDFTYFFFRDDTMETTYHIEFRYGSDLAALQQYMKGQYAYWLAAGIDANADAETIDNVIALFCTENLSAEE